MRNLHRVYSFPAPARSRTNQKMGDHKIYMGIPDVIGQTPLVRLERFLDQPDVRLFAKLEAANPGGSAKDRPARQMIEHALASGEITPSTTVIESSSGNMGIGLAQICRYHGLRFICVVDPNAQKNNLAIMRALGADVRVVDTPVGGDFLTARLELVAKLVRDGDDVFWPNQYRSLQNPLAHHLGTIREIDEALDGELDYLFVATSSTGTARGCRDYLQRRGRSTKVIAVDAMGSVLFDGTAGRRRIPGLGAGKMPPLARGQRFHDVRRVTDLDCVVGCRRLAEREAILVGGSAGGVLETIRLMEGDLSGQTVAAVLHDSGTRYLDTVFDDAWVENELGATPDEIRQLMDHKRAIPGLAVSA